MEGTMVAGVSGLNVIKQYARSAAYDYVIDFGEVVIPAGESLESKIDIQNDADFLVREVKPSCRLAAAVSSSIAGTPLAFEAEPNSDQNELPTMELVRVQIKHNDTPWSNKPVPATRYGPDGWLSHTPLIERNGAVFATIYNDSAVSLKGRITLVGAKLRGRKS